MIFAQLVAFGRVNRNREQGKEEQRLARECAETRGLDVLVQNRKNMNGHATSNLSGSMTNNGGDSNNKTRPRPKETYTKRFTATSGGQGSSHENGKLQATTGKTSDSGAR